MYKKHLVRLVEKLIEEHFKVTSYGRSIKENTETGMVNFKIITINSENRHIVYEGYVGGLGSVVITSIAGEFLGKENFITVV